MCDLSFIMEIFAIELEDKETDESSIEHYYKNEIVKTETNLNYIKVLQNEKDFELYKTMRGLYNFIKRECDLHRWILYHYNTKVPHYDRYEEYEKYASELMREYPDLIKEDIETLKTLLERYLFELKSTEFPVSYSEKLDKIIKHFGIHNQVHKLAEETGELTGEIVRFNGGFVPTNKRITEEFADVVMILNQIRHYYNVDLEEVYEILRSKPDEVMDKYYIK